MQSEPTCALGTRVLVASAANAASSGAGSGTSGSVPSEPIASQRPSAPAAMPRSWLKQRCASGSCAQQSVLHEGAAAVSRNIQSGNRRKMAKAQVRRQQLHAASLGFRPILHACS